MAVAAQITLLLALTAGLLDPIPLEQVAQAEGALHEAAAALAGDLAARLMTEKNLADADRSAILDVARRAIARFLPKPEPIAATT